MRPANATKPLRPPPKRRGSVAIMFREAIAKAVEGGADPEDLTLRLTLSDLSELKRDGAVAVEDISFKGGEMRFLGVKVTGGGIEASRLDAEKS